MSDALITRQLATGLTAMHLELPAAAQSKLLAYLDLLAKWNHAYNLTAVRDPAVMVSRHLLDSLAALPFVAGPALADIGSGAGLPGIPLAIARPELAVTLIESNGKKARFLREAARSLPLPNVTIAQARVQDASDTFDTITARAFASLADMLVWGGHLLAPGGRWLALKGQLDHDEITDIPKLFQVTSVHALDVPGTEGARCLIQLARANLRDPDPATHPRAMVG
ncbi:MAG TPA: 16S rRNA (guanine(527)-N(7))-methyltransferase RsmG [Rhodanobacteraceae bacterium]